VKRRTWMAVVSGLILSSFAVAQTPSHFDLSGNVSFGGAKLFNAPSSSQVNAFGWQTSGVTRVNRWLGVTSQFGSGYASSNALDLIGFTGSAKMNHYSMLVGPRIILPTRTRVSPFVEGLVGADRSSTNLTSNGLSVTGRELQLAYAVGGGALIDMTRRFGVNFEAQYFQTEHTVAFTGWQPANFQISAGIVIHMFGGRTPQIAEQRPQIPQTTTASAEPAPQPAPAVEASASPTSTLAAVQPVTSSSVQPQQVQSQAFVATPESSASVTPVPKPAIAVAAAPVAPSMSAPVMSAKAIAPVQPAPRPQVVAQPIVSAPAQIPASAVVARMTIPAQTQAAPMSLGEYARRIREQRQRERQQQQ
jgi:outer membrane protein with beta-barrel domain